MTESARCIVVADAGPLIHLDELDSLDLLAHGTLGLILRSVRRKLRTAEQALKLLADIPDRCSLHIRPALLEQTVRRAEAEWLGAK